MCGGNLFWAQTFLQTVGEYTDDVYPYWAQNKLLGCFWIDCGDIWEKSNELKFCMKALQLIFSRFPQMSKLLD